MLAKCANPACNAPFLYLRDGRLYQMEVEAERTAPEQDTAGEERKPARRLEFFWLCTPCSQEMTLAYNRGQGVVVVPTRVRQAAAL